MNSDIIRLTRVSMSSKYGTFGVLTLNGEAFCVTLEPPDFDNQQQISSIPVGQYKCIHYSSPKYGNTWEVQNVVGRSKILIHAGNIVQHTKGCIILGQYFGKLMGDRAVLNSGNTFKEFMRITNGSSELHLTIKEIY